MCVEKVGVWEGKGEPHATNLPVVGLVIHHKGLVLCDLVKGSPALALTMWWRLKQIGIKDLGLHRATCMQFLALHTQCV